MFTLHHLTLTHFIQQHVGCKKKKQEKEKKGNNLYNKKLELRRGGIDMVDRK